MTSMVKPVDLSTERQSTTETRLAPAHSPKLSIGIIMIGKVPTSAMQRQTKDDF